MWMNAVKGMYSLLRIYEFSRSYWLATFFSLHLPVLPWGRDLRTGTLVKKLSLEVLILAYFRGFQLYIIMYTNAYVMHINLVYR